MWNWVAVKITVEIAPQKEKQHTQDMSAGDERCMKKPSSHSALGKRFLLNIILKITLQTISLPSPFYSKGTRTGLNK